MATQRTSVGSKAARCPACGARVEVSESARNQRVQCPKCGEVVVLEEPARALADSRDPENPASNKAKRQQRRIEILEARVATLEQAVADAARAASAKVPAEQFKWVIDNPPPVFSPEQADVLRYNLRTVRAHRIMIQFPAAEGLARQHAEWFRDVFARAHWIVQGPIYAPATAAQPGISFASCLPVSRQVAGTYLALRAAAFPLFSAFDPDLSDDEERLVVL